jgi:hypothetical protein
MHVASRASRHRPDTTCTAADEGELGGASDGEGVFEVAPDGIKRPTHLDDRPLPARHLEDLRRDVESAHGLREQSSWVKTTTWRSAEAPSRTRARPSTRAGSMDWKGSAITMKRNGSRAGSRVGEQAEGEGVQLALAHYAEGGARDAVDGDLEDHAPAPAVSRELAHKCLQLLEPLEAVFSRGTSR